MSLTDLIGLAIILALIGGLALDLYFLGKRNGYHAGQVDAAIDFNCGYRSAITDVIVEAERQGDR